MIDKRIVFSNTLIFNQNVVLWESSLIWLTRTWMRVARWLSRFIGVANTSICTMTTLSSSLLIHATFTTSSWTYPVLPSWPVWPIWPYWNNEIEIRLNDNLSIRYSAKNKCAFIHLLRTFFGFVFWFWEVMVMMMLDILRTIWSSTFIPFVYQFADSFTSWIPKEMI